MSRRAAPPTAATTGRCTAGLWLLTGAELRRCASDAVTPGSNVPAKRAAQTADGTRRSKRKKDDGEQ
eukprot:5547390-Pleurochrysis_carterae.AAC.1